MRVVLDWLGEFLGLNGPAQPHDEGGPRVARVAARTDMPLDGRKRHGSPAHRQAEAATEAAQRHGCAMSGEHSMLYKYPENRYANTVILTFAEIEDILGFALPDPARVSREWWTNADSNAPETGYAQSWIQAHRTATPNLQAQTVVFERVQHLVHSDEISHDPTSTVGRQLRRRSVSELRRSRAFRSQRA